MIIGERLRALRELKKMSQGEIEKRTGLLRCYISRVENGHTVPALETLEKMAYALEIPLYQLFYDGDEPPKSSGLSRGDAPEGTTWVHSGKDRRTLERLIGFLNRMDESDRKLVLFMAQKISSRAKGQEKAKKRQKR